MCTIIDFFCVKKRQKKNDLQKLRNILATGFHSIKANIKASNIDSLVISSSSNKEVMRTNVPMSEASKMKVVDALEHLSTDLKVLYKISTCTKRDTYL